MTVNKDAEYIIPEKIVIGFKKDTSCFTKKLGFVNYKKDGELRQELSFNKWRDKNIDVVEVDNVPTEGFFLNKNINRHGHFSSTVKLRVYDEKRDFEFEVSVENLLYLMYHSDINKCDIKGEFVYAWSTSSKSVILLPVDSEIYQNTVNKKDSYEKVLTSKDLKVGTLYKSKKDNYEYIYLCQASIYEDKSYHTILRKKEKKHIFLMRTAYSQSLVSVDAKSIYELQESYFSDEEVDFYVQQLEKSNFTKSIKSFELVPNTNNKYYRSASLFIKDDKLYYTKNVQRNYSYYRQDTILNPVNIVLKNGNIQLELDDTMAIIIDISRMKEVSIMVTLDDDSKLNLMPENTSRLNDLKLKIKK